MNEASFAKQFLAVLDTKPIKYQADYATDLRQLEISGPYTLPRMPESMQMRKTRAAAGGSGGGAGGDGAPSGTVAVSLRSLRNPPLDLTLPGRDPANTTVLDLKKAVAAELGLATIDKVRLLYRKKPCPDLKTIKELLGPDAVSETPTVEFGVMVIGGVPDKSRAEETAAAAAVAAAAAAAEGKDVTMADDPPAAAPSAANATDTGSESMADPRFWADLEGFLRQRTKDADVAAMATKLFEKAWRERPGQ